MAESISKKFSNLFGKIDDRVTKAKMNNALDMLKNGDVEELAKKMNNINIDELLSKISSIDDEKLKELNIDKNELKQKVSDADLSKLSQVIGERGNEIIEKLKDIIN